MKVERVTIQIRRPTYNDPGQISEGFYTFDGTTLTMTKPDGTPIGEQFTLKLKPGDNPAAIAGILTRRVRRSMLGTSADEEAFGRPLNYDNPGIA